MALQGDRLYIGGFFNAVNNVPRGRVALVNKDTGALDPTFNPNADGEVSALAIAPDQSRLYVGGSFLNIAGTAQPELVALDPITGIRQPIVFQQFVGAPLELEVDPSGTRLYAALSGFPGGGNRAVAWNTSTGVRLWRNEAMGDTQAIEYDAGTVYFGFHEGYGGDTTRQMLAADATSGALDPNFRPTVNASSASGPSTAGNNTLAVGGEFTNFDGRQVQGLALLPSLYANDTTPPTVPANLSSPSRTATSVSLGWNASTDNTLLTGYEVLRNGQPVGSSTTTSFTDTALTPATAYTYQVRALDAAGNRSAASGAITATTPLPLVAAVRTGATSTTAATRARRGALRRSTIRRGRTAPRSSATATATKPPSSASDRTRTCGTARPTSATAFNVANPASVQALNLRLLRDDGAVVYINGTEVARSNMPATHNFQTLAPANVDGAAESTYFSFTPPPGVLVAGTNTVAVEVHQNTNASSDLSFDLALEADVNAGSGGDVTAPTAPGALTARRSHVRTRSHCRGTPSTDDTGVTQYVVQRNGTPIGSTSETSFVDVPVGDGSSLLLHGRGSRCGREHLAGIQLGGREHSRTSRPRRCRARSRHQVSRRTG